MLLSASVFFLVYCNVCNTVGCIKIQSSETRAAAQRDSFTLGIAHGIRIRSMLRVALRVIRVLFFVRWRKLNRAKG